MNRLLIGIVIVLALISCNDDRDELDTTTTTYYACGQEDLVVRFKLDGYNANASLFKGKQLIASRGLSLNDEGDKNTYSADDMSVTITDNNLSITYDRFALDSCFVSETEAIRRSNKDTLYYIAENGMLVKCLHLNDSALIQTSLGVSMMLDTILPMVPSGSGVKYEQGNVMFWSKGNTAMLVSDGIIYGHCVRMWSDEINRDPCAKDSRVAAMIRQVFVDDFDSMEVADRRFLADSVDLNNDGKDEIFVMMSSKRTLML